MALIEPETGYVWLHVSGKEAVEVVVVGEVHSWWSHWTSVAGQRSRQAVRCLADEAGSCAWCEAGLGRQARYVIPVRVDGQLRLCELGRVQYPMLKLLVQEPGWIGRRLRLVKQWAAKNAPIDLRPVGREHVSEELLVDIEQHVASLGLVQLRLSPVPRGASPSEPAEPGGGAARSSPEGVSRGATPHGPPAGMIARPKRA